MPKALQMRSVGLEGFLPGLKGPSRALPQQKLCCLSKGRASAEVNPGSFTSSRAERVHRLIQIGVSLLLRCVQRSDGLRMDRDTQQDMVSSEMPRVGRKQVGSGGHLQHKHLGASPSSIPLPILMCWAPGVPFVPWGKWLGPPRWGSHPRALG